MASAQALSLAGLEPVVLEAKEGLALINGTTAMTAVAALAVHDAENLAATADVAGAMSLEAMRGVPAALDPRLHAARPYRDRLLSPRTCVRSLRAATSSAARGCRARRRLAFTMHTACAACRRCMGPCGMPSPTRARW